MSSLQHKSHWFFTALWKKSKPQSWWKQLRETQKALILWLLGVAVSVPTFLSGFCKPFMKPDPGEAWEFAVVACKTETSWEDWERAALTPTSDGGNNLAEVSGAPSARVWSLPELPESPAGWESRAVCSPAHSLIPPLTFCKHALNIGASHCILFSSFSFFLLFYFNFFICFLSSYRFL